MRAQCSRGGCTALGRRKGGEYRVLQEERRRMGKAESWGAGWEGVGEGQKAQWDCQTLRQNAQGKEG